MATLAVFVPALLSAYAQAALATGDAYYARVAAGTAAFLLRDLQSPEGGFYSSFDADSEGHEGRFYVWTPAEVEGVLGAHDASLFCERYGLDGPANFEGAWHLVAARRLEDLASDGRHGTRDADELARRLDAACAKLLAVRSRRIWPS